MRSSDIVEVFGDCTTLVARNDSLADSGHRKSTYVLNHPFSSAFNSPEPSHRHISVGEGPMLKGWADWIFVICLAA